MKPTLPCLLLSALFSLMILPAIRADETSPLFGNTTLSIQAVAYDWTSATEDGTYHTDTYTNLSGATVTVTGLINAPNLATVGGNGISGYLLGGTYGDTVQSSSSAVSQSFNGRAYGTASTTTTYTVDLPSGQVTTTTTVTTYSGESGSFTVDANGVITGSESGYQLNGNWYVNSDTSTTTPSSVSGSYNLLGTTFYFTSGTATTTYDSNGQASSTWTDSFNSADGWLTIAYASMSSTPYAVTGWDPYLGSFTLVNNDFSNPQFAPRTGPSFAPAQFWVNGALACWQSATISADGVINDTYAGGVNVVISGSARGFQLGGSATVIINGSNAGSYASSSFSVSGYSVETAGPGSGTNTDPNTGTTYSTPLFISATTLWVNGTEYLFTGGFQDNAGNRSDSYGNGSTGTLTITGTTGNPGSGNVSVSWYGGSYNGSFNSGSFVVSSMDIQTSPPQPPDPGPSDPVYGPPAFWVRGRFYTRTIANTFQSPEGYQLNLTGMNAANATLNGSDNIGAFNGTLNVDSVGMFVISDGAALVAACPANADGTLRLAGDAPPQDLPPALMVTGAGIWQFLGTSLEDSISNVNTACYGNAAAANSTDTNVGGGCLMKIRLDGSGLATLTNYLANTTASGTYNTQTHLFQSSGPNSGFPTPVCAVDPNSNNALWGLAAPASGPASFVVGNAVWHYTGMDATGAALYAGYYDGQQLALGVAGADGLRLVTVTDPVRGNTQGTLNDLRGSARLRNGMMVYSGYMDGTRIQPTLNENNLAVIAGNLDIAGNVLSLGSLSGDAATSGVTLQFSDTGAQAMLGSALGRSAAQWVWWRVNPNDVTGYVPTMAVDSAFGLALYDPANPAQATIKLNPTGGSSFKGPVHLKPAGDVLMGEFNHGPQP